jgi:transcriptional regulator with XRE-family HTH domain
MRADRVLRRARQHAGVSQRALAARTGVLQSTIGRIETGAVSPRLETMDRLLRACGFDLEVAPALGEGVDLSLIRELLSLSPTERVARLAADARFDRALDTARARRLAETKLARENDATAGSIPAARRQ